MAGRPTKEKGEKSVNKSEAIRELLEKGIVSPKAVVAALEKRGIVVQPSQVSNLNAKRQAGANGSAKAPSAKRAPVDTTLTCTAEHLRLASRFVKSFEGDSAAARNAISELEAVNA